jgi:hypothetical protein
MIRAEWRGSHASLLVALERLPAVLSGREPDPHKLGELFLTVIGNRILDLIQHDFRTKSDGGVGLDGIRWLELKEATLERRRRKGIDGEQILKETGELYASLTPSQSDDPGAPRPVGQVFDLSPGRVTVGTEGTKADVHQYGSGRVPARPIVPDSSPSGWEHEIDDAVEKALEKVIERMCALGAL